MTVEAGTVAFGEGGLHSLLVHAGAIEACPRHPDISIRLGDRIKEDFARKTASAKLNEKPMQERERSVAMDAFEDALSSADDQCCKLCKLEGR
jgi:hypothetical protein